MIDLAVDRGVSQTTMAGDRVASALAPRMQAKTVSEDSASANAATTGSSSATITSNDFLTLLVNELKNQDPTQPTDPGAYIQQLVGVNSLQQLIQINQGLTDLEGAITG